MREGFATLATGMAQITALVTIIARPESDGGRTTPAKGDERGEIAVTRTPPPCGEGPVDLAYAAAADQCLQAVVAELLGSHPSPHRQPKREHPDEPPVTRRGKS